MDQKNDQTQYPRITLKCKCGNEFNINVVRLRDREPVLCQICGQSFSQDIGESFAKALESLYMVKHNLEKDGFPFHFAFLYKSLFKQPPAPHPLETD